jgi:hypothetical protein
MFSKVRRLPIQFSGDWLKDRFALVRWIIQHDDDLERPGALAIGESFAWTPVLTFATPGDLAVTYSSRDASCTRLADNIFHLSFFMATSAFTHTTAAGALQVTGAPVGASSTISGGSAGGQFGGITKAGYTQVCSQINSSAVISFTGSGSGVAPSTIVAADVPTGGTVRLWYSFVYRT